MGVLAATEQGTPVGLACAKSSIGKACPTAASLYASRQQPPTGQRGQHCGQQSNAWLWPTLVNTAPLSSPAPAVCRPGHLLRVIVALCWSSFLTSFISLLTVAYTCNNDSGRTMFYFPSRGGQLRVFC